MSKESQFARTQAWAAFCARLQTETPSVELFERLVRTLAQSKDAAAALATPQTDDTVAREIRRLPQDELECALFAFARTLSQEREQ